LGVVTAIFRCASPVLQGGVSSA